jgi:alpha-glucosidase
VNIYDTENKQYTIPDSVISLPAPPTESFTRSSDLIFNYEPSSFAFCITRRSRPSATPLFDTRVSSLPSTPTISVISNDSTIVFDGFPIVFENQYLQVRYTFLLSQITSYGPQISSALPLNTNIYGLGEVVASSGFRRDVRGTIQTLWNRDAGDPIDENM